MLCHGFIMVSLALALLGPVPGTVPAAAVEGWVTTVDGEPVPDARIAADQVFTISGVDGWYRLDGLAAGPATLTVSHPAHPRLLEHAEIKPGVHRLDWTLEAGCRVVGWVKDEAGEPVADAELTLELLPSEGIRSYSERSASDGAFELAPVAAGRYRLAARAPGYAETALPEKLDVAAAGVGDLEIVLIRGVVLAGQLRGLGLEELARADVRATGEWGTRRGRVEAAGRYEISDLRPGTWLVEAEVDGGRRHARARLELLPDEREVERDLEFGHGVTLTGQVLYQYAPLPGATVSLRGRELAVERTVTTDHQGEFRLADLEPGSYRLEIVQASELLVHNETLRVDADRFVVVELVSAVVSGRVSAAADGSGLGGAAVELRRLPGGFGAEELLVTAGSDAGGFFTVPRVPPGRYRLVARRDGYAPATREIDVRAGLDVVDLELRLAASRGLELVVGLVSGRVPSSATVHVLDTDGRTLIEESRSLDARGGARFTTVPPGRWQIWVSAAGGAVTAARVEVPGGPSEVWLPDSARLTVRVPQLATSDAVAEVRLVDAAGRLLRALDADGALRDLWPVASGLAVIEGVPAGVWRVEATAPDGRTWAGAAGSTGSMAVEVELE